MKEYLFSYGTLQNNNVQLKLFGRLLHGTRDLLEGYRTIPVEITDRSFLSKGEQNIQLTLVETNDPADLIEGMVFELSGEELAAADKYEPAGYRRVSVNLGSGKQAWVYLAG